MNPIGSLGRSAEGTASSVGARSSARRDVPAARRTRSVRTGVVLVGALVAAMFTGASSASAAENCDTAPLGPIACENALPGSPPSEWDIDGTGDNSIQGFATDISVNRGQRVDFKIDTNAAAYAVTIYRLGYYQGLGARRVADVVPSATLPQIQPACVNDQVTLNLDCGNWALSASWNVPANAVSGVYIASLKRTDTGGQSHIPFIVRNDVSNSQIVFQTSDTTWQAYNDFGGTNLYYGPNGKAVKVSYNRPFATRGTESGRDYLFSNEYPMIRFLERNGYDVSYISGIDADRAGGLLLNHDTFVSVGHDEYWSGRQRANVEAARDAGVNLAFFSGNEVYWKTRYESSIDGASTPYRTLVTYKETRDDAKTDPSPEWTGTWRDPRFSPPSDGGKPENALTGTAYMSNFTDLPVTVSDQEGKLRFWRGTGLGSQPAGTSTALAPHTVGYESDEDLDNGFRPAGLIRLSTTTGATPEYLQDYGSTVAPGTTTHNATLYRAASGALVFGAGTVQWAWGLDEYHDGTVSPADPRMQQATMNLFSDMGSQPRTLMPGLTNPTPSTDTTPPTTVITAPAAGSVLPSGTRVTVTGTASDTAGVVAGVEVSLDGGTTWKRAEGRQNWSYTGILAGTGSRAIRARAIDDSVNFSSSGTAVNVSVSCPCSVFGAAAPTTAPQVDTSPVTLGVRVVPQRNGWIEGVRFFKGAGNAGTHTGTLWSVAGVALATATFTNETATGWQEVRFNAPVRVTAGTAYIASYFAPVGRYHAENYAYTNMSRGSDPIVAPAATPTARNGVFAGGDTFPDRSFRDTNYFVDALFTDVDTIAPVVASSNPIAGASSVSTTAPITARFSEVVNAGSIVETLARGATAVPFTLVSQTVGEATVVTITPSATLAVDTTYTVSLRASDVTGNAMPAASTWTFRTSKAPLAPGVSARSLFDDNTPTEALTADDTRVVDLGVRFTVGRDGWVNGARFYKAASNGGTHVARLWRVGDQALLAQATFTGESTAGWQEVLFGARVPVTSGTEYVVTYTSPLGVYSYATNGFGAGGISRAPLTTSASGGVFTYSTGTYPTSLNTTNYFADVIYEAVPFDMAPPNVSARTPAVGATGVGTDAVVRATFGAFVQPGSAAVAVVDQEGGATVAGTVAYAAASRTVTFSPNLPLAVGRTYQVTVDGARSDGGTAMTPVSWTFSTVASEVCPCTLFGAREPALAVADGGGAIEVGVRFTPSVDTVVSGIRFYKSAGTGGTHVGTIWSPAGAPLASVTFTGETASGWQTATLSSPLTVTAGVTYTVSYLSPQGGYSATQDFFGAAAWTRGPLTVAGPPNGVFAVGGGFPTASFRSTNYFVDLVYAAVPRDMTAPVVSSRTPAAGATGVDTAAVVRATFAAVVQPGSAAVVDQGSGAAVAGTVTYAAGSRTVTFTPNVPLAVGRTYQVTVDGARSDGGTIMTPVSWTFSTVAGEVCPCTLFGDREPVTVVADGGAAIEVGTRFTPSTNGTISAIRFYKSGGSAGPHVGTIWSSTGSVLASVTFTNETPSGWQTASLASPLQVTAGTTYTVSYLAPQGGYTATVDFFGATPWTRGPLTAAAAPNGVFAMGGGFPGNSFRSSNYYVDVVYGGVVVDTNPPTVASRAPSASATDVASESVVQATFGAPVTAGTPRIRVIDEVTGAVVSGSTSYAVPTRTLEFSPGSPLPLGRTYRVTVDGATSAGGTAMTAVTWTFTSAATEACPCTLFGSRTPSAVTTDTGGAIEVGTRFTPSVSGQISGVRFYKSAGAAGTHVGTIWSSAGVALATVTFTGESASGWQSATLATPLSVTAGATYTVSYVAPGGGYSSIPGFFGSTAWTRGPLSAPAATNGVIKSGAGYPSAGGGGANYLVDVIFATGPNLALGRPTSQISDGFFGWSSRGVDGNTDGRYSSNSVTHTDFSAQSWWQVDLGEPTAVREIRLWNRTDDCCGSRLSNFHVFVSENDMSGRTLAQLSADPAIGEQQVASLNGASSLVVPLVATGRYVRVQLSATEALSLAEVEVFGTSAPPTVTSRVPAASATGVGSEAVVQAVFGSAVQPGSARVTVVDQGTGAAVAGSLAYTAATRTVQFSPGSPLQLGRTYRVTVDGAASAGGTVMVPVSWTFSTVAAEACPCTLFGARAPSAVIADAGSAIEIGTRFTPSANGRVTGIRFYKSAGASGTHVGTIWSSAGVALSSVTFTAETASGWQSATLATPLSLTAGTAYTVSYLAPSGGYSSIPGFFGSTTWTRGPLSAPGTNNGVIRSGAGYPSTGGGGANYLVDVIFAPEVNLSRAKPATQSSTDAGAVASRAVDGNTDGNWANNSVAGTTRTSQPWWQVDLGSTSTLSSIQLFNRTDCCGARLTNFAVFVSATDMTGRSFDQLRADPAVATRQVSTINGAAAVTLVTAGVQGRYVRVQLASSGEYLSLAEVQVNGYAGATTLPAPTNRAQGRAATQSSTSGSAVASRAVDGNTNGNFSANSVTATGTSGQPWWQVDLAQQTTVNQVRIWNRTDANSSRLANFYVLISPTDMTGRTLAQLLADPTVAMRQVNSLNGASNVTLSTAGAGGRYVRVQLSGTNVLHLAEVQVQ